MAATVVSDVHTYLQSRPLEGSCTARHSMYYGYGVRLYVYQALVNSIEQKLYILGEIARTEISTSNGPNS